MNRFIYLISGITFLISILISPLSAAEWKLVKEKDGIKIYNRPVEGFPVDEFKGIAVIDAPMEVIIEVLHDVPAGTEWMKDCKEARIIKEIDDLVKYLYVHQDAPWPVSDRDAVVKSEGKLSFKKGIAKFDAKGVKEPMVPIKKKCVRMTVLDGGWTLKRIAPDKTEAIYQVRADPAGSIPKFLVNFFSKDIPYHTIMGMRKMVKKEKYIKLSKNTRKRLAKYESK